MNIVSGILTSYLLGSFPTAYLFGKVYKGIDIREHGSGNVGATNVFRVLGKVPGITVLVIDILKGVIALTVVGDLFCLQGVVARALLGVAVVVGHNWTVFLKFKGGKGVATSLGVLIGLTIKFSVLRPVLFICLSGWIISFVLSGYVSLASIFASILMPVVMVLTGQKLEIIISGVVFCGFVVLRHRPNIKRLLGGNESRIFVPFQRKDADKHR
ncbi:MAG: glycerol-3-phosphate 1-O-acyltransferase PlsY [Candidatus Omnitrophica bacterium]|nr:glycerol-3-phosphate 1-O-acyltransferase PlsY [Candidatus Omnitrophota bacterium]